MNLKLLGAFLVSLVLVLGVPALGSALGAGGNAGSAPAPQPQPSSAPSPTQPVQPAPQAQQPAAAPTPAPPPAIPTIAQAPPMLDANSLVGTVWQVSHQMGTIQVQFYGGGYATARHELLGELQGQWQVQGSNVIVTAYIGNKAQTIQAQIRGTELYYQGVQITRLR